MKYAEELADSSISFLIWAGWRQEIHPVTKNLFATFPWIDKGLMVIGN